MYDLKGRTVDFDRENNALVILDQTQLPNEEVVLSLKSGEEIYAAIKELKLRGAPCIGVSAAIAMAVLSLCDISFAMTVFFYCIIKRWEGVLLFSDDVDEGDQVVHLAVTDGAGEIPECFRP